MLQLMKVNFDLRAAENCLLRSSDRFNGKSHVIYSIGDFEQPRVSIDH
jgi:hypothetical protein